MNEDDVRKILEDECERCGGQAAWAWRNNVSASYVSDTLCKRKGPGPTLLAALGIKKVATYEWVS